MATEREVPSFMKKETMAVLEPTSTKTWGGTQVWPLPSSSTLPRILSLREKLPVVDDKWEIIKDGVFAKNENYAKPVNALYAKDTEITELDKHMLRRAFEKEREYRRVQNNERKELLRIAKARQLVADKRKMREERMTKKGLMESYQHFKRALLLESDNPHVLAASNDGLEMDAEMSKLLQDAKLGCGSVALARPVTVEVAHRVKLGLASKLEASFLRHHHRSTVSSSLGVAREELESRHRHCREGSSTGGSKGGSAQGVQAGEESRRGRLVLIGDGAGGGEGRKNSEGSEEGRKSGKEAPLSLPLLPSQKTTTITTITTTPVASQLATAKAAAAADGGDALGWDWFVGSTKATSPRVAYKEHRAAKQVQKLWRGFSLRTVDSREDSAALTHNSQEGGGERGSGRFRSAVVEAVHKSKGSGSEAFHAHNLGENARRIRLLGVKKAQFEAAGKRLETLEAEWQVRVCASREQSREQRSREQQHHEEGVLRRRSRSSSRGRESHEGEEGREGGSSSVGLNKGERGRETVLIGSARNGFRSGDYGDEDGGDAGEGGGFAVPIVPWGSDEILSRSNTAERNEGGGGGGDGDHFVGDPQQPFSFQLPPLLRSEGRSLQRERSLVDAAVTHTAACVVQRFAQMANATSQRRRGKLPSAQHLLKRGSGSSFNRNKASARGRGWEVADDGQTALRRNQSRQRAESGQRQRRDAVLRRAERGLAQFQRRFRRFLLASGRERRARGVLSRLVNRTRFRGSGAVVREGLREVKKGEFKGAVGVVVLRVRAKLTRILRSWRALAGKQGVSREWVASQVLLRRVRCIEGMLFERLALKRLERAKVLTECLDASLTSSLSKYKQSGWEWSSLLRALDVEFKLLDPPPAFAMHLERHGNSSSSSSGDDGDGDDDDDGSGSNRLMGESLRGTGFRGEGGSLGKSSNNGGGGSGGGGILRDGEAEEDDGGSSAIGAGTGSKGDGRRLFRLLGVRAPSEPHPALVHLLLSSDLHRRVLVPPPSTENPSSSSSSSSNNSTLAAASRRGATQGQQLLRAAATGDNETHESVEDFAAAATTSSATNLPTPMFPEIGSSSSSSSSSHASVDFSSSSAGTKVTTTRMATSSSGAYSVVFVAAAAPAHRDNDSLSIASGSADDAPSSTSTSLVVYGCADDFNDADDADVDDEILPLPQGTDSARFPTILPSSAFSASASASWTSRSVRTWSEAVSVTMTSTTTSADAQQQSNINSQQQLRPVAQEGEGGAEGGGESLSSLEAIRKRPKLKSQNGGPSAALVRQKAARREASRVHRHLPLALWRLLRECSHFFAACRVEQATKQVAQTALEERSLLTEFLDRALEVRGLKEESFSRQQPRRRFYRWLHEWETCPRCHAMVTHPTGEGKGVVDTVVLFSGSGGDSAEQRHDRTPAKACPSCGERFGVRSRALTAAHASRLRAAAAEKADAAAATGKKEEEEGEKLAAARPPQHALASVKDLHLEPFTPLVNQAALAFLCPVGGWRRAGLLFGSPAASAASSTLQDQDQDQDGGRVLKSLWPAAVALAKPLVSAWASAGVRTVGDLAAQRTRLYALLARNDDGINKGAAAAAAASASSSSGTVFATCVSSESDLLVGKVLYFLKVLDELIQDHGEQTRCEALALVNAPPTLRDAQRSIEARHRRSAATAFAGQDRAAAHLGSQQKAAAAAAAVQRGVGQPRSTTHGDVQQSSGSSGGGVGQGLGVRFGATQRPTTTSTNGKGEGEGAVVFHEEPTSPLSVITTNTEEHGHAQDNSGVVRTQPFDARRQPPAAAIGGQPMPRREDEKHEIQPLAGRQQPPMLNAHQQEIQRRYQEELQRRQPEQGPQQQQRGREKAQANRPARPRGRTMFSVPGPDEIWAAVASSSDLSLATTSTATAALKKQQQSQQQGQRPQLSSSLSSSSSHALSGTMRHLHLTERRMIHSSAAAAPSLPASASASASASLSIHHRQTNRVHKKTHPPKAAMFAGADAHRIRPRTGALYAPPR